MPIYEYECNNQHRFEIWQSIKDDALKECPTCGSPVRKIFHPAGIIFKGSGWYITDSRKGADAAKSESKGGEGEKKADAKPDTPSGGEGKSDKSS